MADPFSIVASSFAVVGVTDVVLRLSAECYRFLSDIKDAPAEIVRLRNCVKDNEQLLVSLKRHVDELRCSGAMISPPTPASNSDLDGLPASIRALQRELGNLKSLAKKHGGRDKTWARIKWVLDDRKVNKSVEKLESTKATLSLALALVQGRQSSSSQKRIETSLQQNFQSIKTTLDSQMQEISAVRVTQEKFLVGQEKIIHHVAKHQKNTSLLRKDLQRATNNNRFENAKTRQTIQCGNKNVINTISSKLDSLRIAAPRKAMTNNREIHFIGENRESILTPLLLMKNQVQVAVASALSNHTGDISPQSLFWLQSEFDTLVSSATQEAASFCRGSTATPFDVWTYSARGKTNSKTTGPSDNSTATEDYDNRRKDKRSESTPGGKTLRRKSRKLFKIFSSSSAVGRLDLTVVLDTDAAGSPHHTEEARVSFTPSRAICTTSMSARFIKTRSFCLEPRLYAQLHAFRLVNIKTQNLHWELIRSASIQDIDAAFKSGILSPYDQNRFGVIVTLQYAAQLGRCDVLDYLDNQGLGPSHLNGDVCVLQGYWFALRLCLDSEIGYESLRNVYNYIERRITECPPNSGISLLSHRMMPLKKESSEESIQLIKMWMGFLKSNDYDFDQQDIWGRILMYHYFSIVEGGDLRLFQLLLEFEFGVQDIDPHGKSILHYAILSYEFSKASGVMEVKISMLIEAGADIHHRDKHGRTPSYCARVANDRRVWKCWCRALERNGLKIEDVVREDGELYLLEGNCREESEEEQS